ncbi:MAG: hypothetical protein JWR10_1823 [Rubritepida sp.]|nr:hypothetical protein [Rubritepida sp.]
MQRIVFDTGYDVGEELDLLELGLAPIALSPEPRIALHNSIDRDGVEIWRA